MTKNNSLRKEQAKTVKKLLFLPLLLITLFSIIPLLLMVFCSFTDWDGFSKNLEFVAFDNYGKIFREDNIAAFSTIKYYILSGFFQFFLGLTLSAILFFSNKYKKILLVIFLFPLLLNSVAIGLMFKLFLSPGGMLDNILDILNIVSYTSEDNTIKWIGNQEIVNYTLAFISLWRYTPYSFLLFYSAMNSIDKNILDAAKIDGASKLKLLLRIIIPNIKVTLSIVISMLIVGSISALEIPMIVTAGALNTQTVLMRINEIAFQMRDYGLASVVSIITIVIIVIILVIQKRVLKEFDE